MFSSLQSYKVSALGVPLHALIKPELTNVHPCRNVKVYVSQIGMGCVSNESYETHIRATSVQL